MFTIPVTLLGFDMAFRHSSDPTPGRALAVLVANVLAVTFAFMINDVEDAPDDVRDPVRRTRNPVAGGDLSPAAGWIASLIVGGLALTAYILAGQRVVGVGALTVGLAFLYSWRFVRLKALPVVDVIAHVLMLSSLLFLAAYLVIDPAPGAAWWVAVGVGCVSAYGQFYNQLRDYDMDRAAQLHNTADRVGYANTRRLMWASLGLAGVCLVVTLFLGLWPLWLICASAALIPVVLWFRSPTDMRGTAAVDPTGRLQLGFMLGATVVLAVWLLVNVTG